MATTADMTQPRAPSVGASKRITWGDYARVGVIFVVFSAALVVLGNTDAGVPRRESLLRPMFAMLGLTAIVWLLMIVFRNGAILRGLASPAYYVAYNASPPPDWIERPARTFNNLMQVPTLFHLVCLAMVSTGVFDAAQLAFAWVYVGVRVVHACVYMGWNHVPYRFTSWVCSCIALAVLWTRFALQTFSGW